MVFFLTLHLIGKFSDFFNSFPNKPWFLCVCNTSLLKTLWEKKKLLVTSNFPISHSVFYSFGELYIIFLKLKIVVCNFIQLGRVWNLSFGNKLTNNTISYKIWYKLKAVTDDKLNVDKLEIWAGDNNLLLSDIVFEHFFSSWLSKIIIVKWRVNWLPQILSFKTFKYPRLMKLLYPGLEIRGSKWMLPGISHRQVLSFIET